MVQIVHRMSPLRENIDMVPVAVAVAVAVGGEFLVIPTQIQGSLVTNMNTHLSKRNNKFFLASASDFVLLHARNL